MNVLQLAGMLVNNYVRIIVLGHVKQVVVVDVQMLAMVHVLVVVVIVKVVVWENRPALHVLDVVHKEGVHLSVKMIVIPIVLELDVNPFAELTTLEHVRPTVVSIVWILLALHCVLMHVQTNVPHVLIRAVGNVVPVVQNVLQPVV